jgi:hypothetical protein
MGGFGRRRSFGRGGGGKERDWLGVAVGEMKGLRFVWLWTFSSVGVLLKWWMALLDGCVCWHWFLGGHFERRFGDLCETGGQAVSMVMLGLDLRIFAAVS